MSKIRVLLADDHQMFLAGLQKLLESQFDVVGAVADGRAMRDEAVRLEPDVIVADISMPLLNGIDAVRSLRLSGSKAKVIFLTMHGDALYVQQALRAGAAAYILKRDAPDRLVEAIKRVAAGEVLHSEHTSAAQPSAKADSSRTGSLTMRQREIWQLLAEGKTPKQIAGILNLSTRTVEFHKYEVMKRLGISSAAELTATAIRHGLIAGGD